MKPKYPIRIYVEEPEIDSAIEDIQLTNRCTKKEAYSLFRLQYGEEALEDD